MYICVWWEAGHMCVDISAHQDPKLMSEIILYLTLFIEADFPNQILSWSVRLVPVASLF